MSSNAGLAVIPVLGAALFILLPAIAQKTDLTVQRAESMGRRVLMRPWSIVSDDASKLGHWLTLAAACAFATTVPATSIWQLDAANEDDVLLVVSASLTAACFFLMALVPHRDSRSSPTVTFSAVWHAVMAGGFLCFGTIHAIRNAVFGIDSTSVPVRVARFVTTGIMGICVCAQLFGAIYVYYTAAKVFNAAYFPPSGDNLITNLSEQEDYSLRKKMVLLCVLQACWGVAYGIGLATCASELSELGSGNDVHVGGIVCGTVFAGTLLIALASYWRSRK